MYPSASRSETYPSIVKNKPVVLIGQSFFPALIFVVFWGVFFSTPAWPHDQPSLLVLHSYRPTYQWTRNINTGIFSTLDSAGREINVKIEYMDIIKKNDANYFEMLRALYGHKYRATTFDAIICSDNYALNFLLKHRAELFPETPVVFCGINRFSDAMMEGHQGVTGVVEDIDLESSIELMLGLHETIDQVAIWSVVHKRSEKNRGNAVSAIKSLAPAVGIVHLRDKSLAQGIGEIRNLHGKTAVLLLSVIRDDEGHIIPVNTTARTISQSIDAPVYSLWDFFLGHGIVGGKLTSGFKQGQISAQMALRVLDGTPVSELPIVRKSPNPFMFDHHQLVRFGIKIQNLPDGAVVINKPDSFYAKYRYLVWGVAVVLALLSGLIITLTTNIIRRIKVERELQESRDLLEKRVRARTSELNETNLELQRFERMVSTTPDLVSLVDRDYMYRFVNDAYLEAFQKIREDIVGKSVIDLIGSELFEKVSKTYIDKALNGDTAGYETWMELPVMGRRFLAVSYHPVGGSDGRVRYVSVAARDITDLKRSEESLKAYSDRLSLASRSAGIGVWEWDIGRSVLIWDERMMRIYQVEPDEFTGEYTEWRKRVHPDDIDAAEKHLLSAAEQPDPFELEFRIVRPDGKIRFIRAAALTQFDDQGSSQRVIGVNWDITESRKAAELQKEKERLQGVLEMSGAVCHELSQPLMALFGFSELLMLKSSKDGETHAEIAKILKQIQRIREISGRIRNIAKYETKPYLNGTIIDLDKSSYPGIG